MPAAVLAAIVAALVNLLVLAYAYGKLNANVENERLKRLDDLQTAKSWSDGLGSKCRGIEAREERRHKQMIAALLMNATDDKQKERLAALLRDDSWS